MNVQDLTCWPPRWRRVSSASGEVVGNGNGILIAARWDHKTQTLALTMEDGGDRHVAVLEDTVRVLWKLSLLLDSQIGRSLAKVGSLEITL